MTFRLGTFARPGEGAAPFPALVLGERVIPLGRLALLFRRLNVSLTAGESILGLLSSWDRNFTALSAAADALAAVGTDIESIDVKALQVRPPVDLPRQIFCTIANYRGHILDTVRDPVLSPPLREPDTPECLARAEQAIEERRRSPPYVCFKLPTTVIGPSDPLELPPAAQRPDWELELAAVIGRAGRHIPRRDAMRFVAGYTLVNDITVRDWVLRADLPRLGSDWLQSKNAPGFLPTGPYLVPAAFVPDPYAVRLTLRLNGDVVQDELCSDMLFDIETQIEYISKYAQLLPGDLICTGTPAGCGIRYKRFLKPGDTLEASAPGFGAQRTRCVAVSL
jgi:2-keto-4-pentenoate hydratase/2-oxohepta-3-ene-1,7-dioic acid hydratase in catechol pathway